MLCEAFSDSSITSFPFSLSTLRSPAKAGRRTGGPFILLDMQCLTGRSFIFQIILVRISKVKQVTISLIHHQGVICPALAGLPFHPPSRQGVTTEDGRSLLFAAYCLYTSIGAPRRLVSNTLLVPRALPKSTIIST